MECFGDSSDEEDEELVNNNTTTRDESGNGICCFHPNTEASLLAHVRNNLPTTEGNSNSIDIEQRADDVLNAIDTFCMSRHWMMHIGPEKGNILIGALEESIRKHLLSPSNKERQFVAVELGTYCGYSSILMGKAMYKAKQQFTKLNCHLFTTEIHREYYEIATEMIQLTNCMDGMISVHQTSFDGHDTDMVDVIRSAIEEQHNPQQQPKIDFLFIDHDKDSYLSDLCKLEESGMICTSTKVVADNVLFASIDDYLGYVQQRKKEGIVETRTVKCKVEYSGGSKDNNEDGVEITDYLQDPSSAN